MTIEDRTSPLDRVAAQSTTGERMLIERLMPCDDAVRAEHRIVPGDIATVYAATRRADFIRAWRSPSPSGCCSPPAAWVSGPSRWSLGVSCASHRHRSRCDSPTCQPTVTGCSSARSRPTRSRSASSVASGPGRPSGRRSTPPTSRHSQSPASERSPATSHRVPTAPAAYS